MYSQKMASCTVSQNLKIISDMLRVCYMNAPTSARALTPPRLVAVSKTKPKELSYVSKESIVRLFMLLVLRNFLLKASREQ